MTARRITAMLTTDERDLIVSALQYASTYAVEADLAADSLARRLAALPIGDEDASGGQR